MRRTRGAWSVIGLVSSLTACGSGEFDSHPAGASSGSGEGGAGGDAQEPVPACEPGATTPCYSGPDGTEAVGACKAGVATCRADGSGFGECTGEVVPAEEDCATPEDDDCDGEAVEEAAGCVCTPGQSASCYTGTPGTEGVGVCIGGVATCRADGTQWGPCSGEATPIAEDCAMPADEDCDGVACSENLWAKISGIDTQQGIGELAVDPAGNIYAAGAFSGTLDFGGGAATSIGNDAFVVKLDASGQHVWTQTYGAAGTDYIAAIASDGVGVYVAGTFAASIFGTLTTSAPSGFVARLSVATGDVVWSHKLDFGTSTTPGGLALDGMGHLVVAGYHSDNGTDAFVTQLDVDDGAPTWLHPKMATGLAQQAVRDVACDAAGNILVTGFFGATLDFGSPVSTSGVTDLDAFVAKLTSSGDHVWTYTHAPAPAGQQHAWGLRTDGNGNVWSFGIFEGTVDFGGGPMSGGPGGDGYLLKLDANGKHQLSKQFGSANGAVVVSGIALNAAGDVSIATNGAGGDFGAGPLPQLGGWHDIQLAKLTAQGAHVWSKAVGSADTDGVASLVLAPSGEILVAGYTVADTIDFGAGPIALTGANSAFVAAFAP